MPRDLLLAARSEIRASTGHWAQGFTALGESITKHDRRMADGSCCTCALLELLDTYLHPHRTNPQPLKLMREADGPELKAFLEREWPR